MKLDYSILKSYCEDETKKEVAAIEQEELVSEFFKVFSLYGECLQHDKAYNVASSLRSFDMWHRQRNSDPKRITTNPGEVYYIDFGGYNLKYETGYVHPGIVIRQYGSAVFVVPCSTKSYGKGYKYVKDLPMDIGLDRNTGVLLNQSRTISTNRILGFKPLKKLDPEVFLEIETDLFSHIFPVKAQNIEEFEAKFKKKKLQYEEQLKKKKILVDKLNNKDNEISELRQKISTLQRELEQKKESQ